MNEVIIYASNINSLFDVSFWSVSTTCIKRLECALHESQMTCCSILFHLLASFFFRASNEVWRAPLPTEPSSGLTFVTHNMNLKESYPAEHHPSAYIKLSILREVTTNEWWNFDSHIITLKIPISLCGQTLFK